MNAKSMNNIKDNGGGGLYVKDLKLKDIAATSAENYKVRLAKLEEVSGGKSFMYILTHPREIYKVLVEYTGGKCVTVANYVTAVCKVFSSYPDLAEKYARSYKKWKQLLYKCRDEQNKLYSGNMAPEKKLAQVVSMPEIVGKYQELKAGENAKNTMRALLLSCFMNLAPKRADLGNVHIYLGASEVPKDSHLYNFIYLGTGDKYNVKPFIQINRFKTASTHKGGIRENINEVLYKDIVRSLEILPRKYLFVDKQGRPYTKNNSYSQFVKRAFEGLFGKGKNMGVSLWRHVYVSSQIDFNKMSEHDIAEKIKNMGTSEAQVRQVYKWINMNAQKGQVCETVCKPISPSG